MIEFRILGLEDGKYELGFEINVENVPCLLGEFKDEKKENTIKVIGSFNLLGEKLVLNLSVKAIADLVCDLTSEQYSEEIEVELDLIFRLFEDDVFLIDDNIYDKESYSLKGYRIDITQIVCDELALAIPMKKIAPRHRGKELSDIFPEMTRNDDTKRKENLEEQKQEKENPWANLKKINFN
jgi:DUF177 domain-containing protein